MGFVKYFKNLRSGKVIPRVGLKAVDKADGTHKVDEMGYLEEVSCG